MLDNWATTTTVQGFDFEGIYFTSSTKNKNGCFDSLCTPSNYF
jgi:hypothetical protein